MLVKKNVLKKELLLIAAAVISAIVINNTDNIFIHVSLFAMLCGVSICCVNFDFLHPYFWFSVFFGIYSVGYPLMISIGNGLSRIAYNKASMLCQILALITALIVISPEKNEKINEFSNREYRLNLGLFNKIIYSALVLLIIVGAVLVVRYGFAGKDEVYSSGNVFLRIIFRLPLVLSFLYVLSAYTTYVTTKHFPFFQMLITGIALTVLTLFSGERDFVFRFIIINVMLLWAFNIIEMKHLLVLGPVGIVLIPLSSTYKYFFLRGVASKSDVNFVASLLSGEFESASRNLMEIMNCSEAMKGTRGFVQLFYDLISAFTPNIESTTAWFNNTFYSNSVTQYGFSLVGEGYVIDGVTGIVVLFVLVGWMIRWFYRKASSNGYMFAAYIYFSTIIIYSIRADFSTILAGIVKQIILVGIILYIAEKMGSTEKRR